MGTSFSALILASISSQTSALFWNKTLRQTHCRVKIKQEQTLTSPILDLDKLGLIKKC